MEVRLHEWQCDAALYTSIRKCGDTESVRNSSGANTITVERQEFRPRHMTFGRS